MSVDAGLQQIGAIFTGQGQAAAAAQAGPASAGVSVGGGLGGGAGLGDVERIILAIQQGFAAMPAPRHRKWTWEELHPFSLPDNQGSSATGAISLTSEHWAPRAGYYWDFHRITVSGLAAGDSVKVYSAGAAAAAGQTPFNEIDQLTGAGSGTDTLYPGSKGAALLSPSDYLVVAGTVTSAAVLVNGSGVEIRMDCLPDYLS